MATTTIRVVADRDAAVRAAGDMQNQGLHVMSSSEAETIAYSDADGAEVMQGFVVIGLKATRSSPSAK